MTSVIDPNAVPVAGGVTTPAAAARSSAAHAGRRALIAIGGGLLSIVMIVLFWQLLVKSVELPLVHLRLGFRTDKFVTRGPFDVWRFLTGARNGDGRHQLLKASQMTAWDTAVGLVAGVAAALIAAMTFNLSRLVEQAVMPVAMAFRAIPLVAMTPLIVLIFHRGVAAVAVIAGIVTFFPVLINVTLALRAVPSASMDLLHAYGGSAFTTLRRVQLPASLPALFASIRVAAPLAFVGALLAENLATGGGLGYLMLQSQFSSRYDLMWTAVAIATFGAVLLYAGISALEQLVLGRFGDVA